MSALNSQHTEYRRMRRRVRLLTAGVAGFAGVTAAAVTIAIAGAAAADQERTTADQPAASTNSGNGAAVAPSKPNQQWANGPTLNPAPRPQSGRGRAHSSSGAS